MATAKITGAGMGSIAMLVAVLWACILGEHLIVQKANREYSQAMTEIRLLQKKRVTPVSAPADRPIVRPDIG